MIFRKHLKKMKNKKGALTIEVIIGMMLFLLGFSFIVDLIILGSKYQVISQTTTSIARTAGAQGGFLSSAPQGYPGGYITSSDAQSRVKTLMQDSGVTTYNLSLPGKTDYGNYMNVSLSFDYKFDLLSNFIPGNLTMTFKSKRIAYSEFKYRYSDFEGS